MTEPPRSRDAEIADQLKKASPIVVGPTVEIDIPQGRLVDVVGPSTLPFR